MKFLDLKNSFIEYVTNMHSHVPKGESRVYFPLHESLGDEAITCGVLITFVFRQHIPKHHKLATEYY